MSVPRIIAIETTKRCNLHCIHCRAAAEMGPEMGTVPAVGGLSPFPQFPPELTKDEIFRLFDEVASRVKPIVILTGGEPLLRGDIFDIARRGTEFGFHVAMAPNGTLMDESVARRMVESGVQRISISLDAASAEAHDAFRNMPGAFAGAMKGIEAARKVGLPFQINTSVTAFNVQEIPKVHELAKSLGASGHHIFMLVRVGRGRQLDAELSAAEQEKILNWLYDRHREGLIYVRATCAPHYFRILTQRQEKGSDPPTALRGQTPFLAITRGCTAGDRFVFISSTGHVQPCGYLDIDCGDVRRMGFWKIWDESPVLQDLRDEDRLRGKCGLCDFRRYCGGCRARAYAATGDYLAEESACLYRPKG